MGIKAYAFGLNCLQIDNFVRSSYLSFILSTRQEILINQYSDQINMLKNILTFIIQSLELYLSISVASNDQVRGFITCYILFSMSFPIYHFYIIPSLPFYAIP